jgi:hypothetical protein
VHTVVGVLVTEEGDIHGSAPASNSALRKSHGQGGDQPLILPGRWLSPVSSGQYHSTLLIGPSLGGLSRLAIALRATVYSADQVGQSYPD